MINLEVLLEEANSAQHHLPTMPLKEAQREEFAFLRQQIEAKPDLRFQRWQEVCFAHRSSSLIDELTANAVFVFWAYITPEQVEFRLRSVSNKGDIYSYANPDCLIAHMGVEVGLRFDVADSAFLLPVYP